MTITVESIRGVLNGEAAEILLVLRSGEESQTIKGKISVSQLSELGLASRMGKSFEIDRMTCDAVLRCMKLYAAIGKGISLLGFAKNTKKTLARKLVQKGYPADIAEEAVEYLASHGYIREENDAEMLVETLAFRKCYGKSRIRQELFKKGFSAEVISEAIDTLLSDCGGDFVEVCAHRIETMGGLPLFEDKERKQKTIASLMRYGFSFDEIREAVALLRQNEIN